MALKNATESHNPSVSIAPQAVTATLNGSGVDHAGYLAASVLIALGVFAGTTPTATVQIQESDDNSVWNAAPAASLAGGGVIPAITPANANTMVRRGYVGFKRYLRVSVTAIAGAGASLPMCAVCLLDEATKRPTTTSTT